MTYKLNPIIEKIQSPVKLLLLGDEQRNYGFGTDASSDSFDHNYAISSIRAEGGVVVIDLVEAQTAGSNWIGEEQSFF